MTNQPAIYNMSDLTDDLILNERTQRNAFVCDSRGSLAFGHIPQNNFGFPAGEVRLKLGLIGSGKIRKGAFGLRHVHEKHSKEFYAHDIQDTIRFIESILRHGAEVLWDKTDSPDKEKLLVLESDHGLVSIALAELGDGTQYYHVITSYGKTRNRGVKIGTFEI